MTLRGDYNTTVLVDMDGVLANFDGAIIETLPQHVPRIERMNWILEDDYPEHAHHIQLIMTHPEFFHNLQPIDGALEGWQRLLDLGYQPRICSAPLDTNERCVEGKRAWIERYLVPEFGPSVLEQAIIDQRKFNYDGIALIDDKPEVDKGDGRASWQHIVFDRTYNQTSPAPFRLHGWADPELETILENAKVYAQKILRR